MKVGDRIGKYTLIEQIGKGGNAIVWKVSGKEGDYALKILLRKFGFEKKYRRFRNEVLFLIQHNTYAGIIPIIDYHLPNSLKDQEDAWYVMPIATPISEAIKDFSTKEIVDSIKRLAIHLSPLHDIGIVHRDIKPSNLYKYNKDWCFGDFGLVDYPGKDDLTEKGESVGPKWTMAPEMKRNAKNADGKKADVYSLAKTLWIMLTREWQGFEGQYRESDEEIRLKKYRSRDYLVEIEHLLTIATSNNPNLRPSIEKFYELLETWEMNEADFSLFNLKDWDFIQKKLFTFAVPQTCEWRNREDIVKILTIVSETQNVNHMFFPGGGGLDLNHASLSQYDNCIELTCSGFIMIISPQKLIYENIGDDPDWSYFRVEANELEESNVDEKYFNGFDEELVELEKGVFVGIHCWTYKHYNDKPLPKGARKISRMLKGTLVIFGKSSKYNSINATYDGRHAKMGSNEFRLHVEQLKTAFEKYEKEKKESKANKEDLEISMQVEDASKDGAVTTIDQENFDQYVNATSFTELNSYIIKNVEDVTSTCIYGIEACIEQFLYRSIVYHLNKDFYFKKKNVDFWSRKSIDMCNDALFSNINDIETVIKIIEKQISRDIDLSEDLVFSINTKRIFAPTHLFTLEELNAILISGDDSHNNVLAINEEGFLELINPHDVIYYRRFAFPVRFEGFDAYNNYVGKYTPLNNSRNEYLAGLEGWCRYLSSEKSQYIDYYEMNKSEQELINEINQIIRTKIDEGVWKERNAANGNNHA